MWFKIKFGREHRSIGMVEDRSYQKMEAIRMAMDILRREDGSHPTVEETISTADKIHTFIKG